MPAAAPQQAYYGTAPSTSKGSGHGGAMMGGLLGVGAGLLGGAMLEHAFDDHNYDGPDTVETILNLVNTGHHLEMVSS